MLVYLQAMGNDSDRTRFEALYLAYRGLMFHMADRILRNEQDAEDAVHQAFLKLAERMELVPESLGPQTRALAVTIAERKAIDLYRAKRRHPTADLDEVPLSYEQALPADGTLAGAMAALPPRYREVLLLKYYNGYDSGEIAGFLDTTPENVRQIITRAKKKLAAELRERGMVP
ncbi:RNA polymerase sigma factor [uncultured Dysosmobacter sp.]|uniref:RNA polymerase sigma factor n=1 Tax=uncultured Dysosmobacter sp. TaxID=2591384 RepID=UPI00260376F0|nr:sigma-70 family RNA polymerase sigma factor [uncultured Dysosmobacter sp.]